MDKVLGNVADHLLADLVALAGREQGSGAFLEAALASCLATCGGESISLVRLTSAGARVVAQSGAARKPPPALAADALDRESVVEDDSWAAAPLGTEASAPEALLVAGADSADLVATAAASLADALNLVRRHERDAGRIERLETILAIAQDWNRTNEMEPLLVQMAEAATRLLAADRASIFLWDRPNKKLIARPALGVEGGQLILDEDVGVVGQVIKTGNARRVDLNLEQESIDRQVDTELGYQTRTLVCVPLLKADGDVLGAFEVLNKQEGNFTAEDEEALAELAAHASIALENTQQLEDLLATHRQIVDQAAEGVQLIGESPAIQALHSTIERVANTDLAILILGENGTGKEVVSQSMHYLSARRDQPFIAVNCAALTETLLESELFGHEKGAFTDAHEARAGKFELASGGTLFLDEIGDLSLGGQAKLLRVLEEKVVVRVGGSTPIHTDARVIAATNQNLAEMVRTKKFREDLYFRLNVVTLELPPLRERGDDVLLLAEHFLKQFCQHCHRKVPKFTAAARKRLVAHPWPGNVRELRNLMERLAYLTSGEKIEAEDLAFILSPGQDNLALIDSGLELTEATHRFQTEYIKSAIDRARGNMSEAATALGLHRSNLYRKMRQLGMGEDESDEP